jgi:hypothetical protein
MLADSERVGSAQRHSRPLAGGRRSASHPIRFEISKETRGPSAQPAGYEMLIKV